MPRPSKYPSGAARQAAYRQRLRGSQAHGESTPGHPPGAVIKATTTDPAASAPHSSNRADYRRWHRVVLRATIDVQSVGAEMDDYFDQRSEAWQEDERGEAFAELQETHEQLLALLEDFVQLMAERCPVSARAVPQHPKEVPPPTF